MAAHFAERYAQHLRRPVPTIDEGVVAHLQAYAWPGNVRELEHLIQRAVLLCKGGVMRVEDLSPPSVGRRVGELSSAERRTGDADQATPAEGVGRKAAACGGVCKRPTGGSMAYTVQPRCWVCTRRSCVTACRNTGYDARRSSAGRKSLYRRPTANESRGGPRKSRGGPRKKSWRSTKKSWKALRRWRGSVPHRKTRPIILSIMFFNPLGVS